MANHRAQRLGCGQTDPTILVGDKERKPMWPDPAGRRKKNGQMKKNVHYALMPTTENGSMWPQCCMVGIRLTITWQCEMVVSPVVRYSGRSAFRHGASQTVKPSDFYI